MVFYGLIITALAFMSIIISRIKFVIKGMDDGRFHSAASN